MEDPMLKQVDTWRRLWCGELTLEQACGRICGPTETWAHTGAGLRQYLWPLAGSMLEQSVPAGLHPMGRTDIGEFCGGLSPVGGTPHWSRGIVWGVLPLRRKRGRDSVWWTDCNPLLYPSAPLGGGGREYRSKVKPRKEGKWGKVF